MIDFTLMSRKHELVGALCDLLSIESVKSEPQNNMPYGKGVFDALMQMLNLSESMYFDSVNLFSHLGYVEYGDGDEIFAVLVHLDVVPAGEGWTVPPFAGTVKDGRVYGRGAIDNKGPAIAALFALSAINENCISLNKRVRLIFGCDEESGWSDIDFYKQNGGEEPGMAISPDAHFPIINAEKGLVQLELTKRAYEVKPDGPRIVRMAGGGPVNVVPARMECELLGGDVNALLELVSIFNEDAPVKIEAAQVGEGVTLVAHGLSAHGSTPEEGKNAAAAMIAFLNTLPLRKDHISDAVYQLARYIGMETDGRSLGVAGADESGALTLNLGYLHADADKVTAGLDIRYPVHTPKEPVLAAVREKLTEFDVNVKLALDAHFVPEDSELVRGLKEAYEEVTGEAADCLSMGGATYARAFQNAVAFGPLFPGDKGTMHQPDEYIEIDNLIKMADIIADAIVILCG